MKCISRILHLVCERYRGVDQGTGMRQKGPQLTKRLAVAYTAFYIQQASPAMGGAPINIFDIGPGGIVKGSHPILSNAMSYMQKPKHNSDIYITMLVPGCIYLLR